MPIFLDGHAVFAAIAANPLAFADVKSDVLTQAEKLLTKQLKKTTNVDGLRAVFAAVGRGAAATVVDILKDSEVATLVKKLDKLRAPSLEIRDARSHLVELGFGEIEPLKPEPKAKTPKKKAPPKGLLESTDAFAEAHVRESAVTKPAPQKPALKAVPPTKAPSGRGAQGKPPRGK